MQKGLALGVQGTPVAVGLVNWYSLVIVFMLAFSISFVAMCEREGVNQI